MKPVFIYTLNCPITGVVRYAGQTTDPDKRLSKHITTARKEKYHCACWINSLLKKKLRPVMEILDVVPGNEADFWETEYIQNFRERGFDLTNVTPGGEAGPVMKGADNPFFGKTHSPEALVKIIAANVGKPPNITSFKRGLIPWCKGKKQSPEHITKNREAHLGQIPWNKGKICPKISAALTGKKHSPETLAKLTGKKRTPEQCENISASLKGKPWSPLRTKRFQEKKNLWPKP